MKKLHLFVLTIFLGLLAFNVYPQKTVVWSDGFEEGMGDWYASNGTWQVGVPTSGPNAANTGAQCAATILNGNYSGNVNSRLISPAFTIPSLGQNPRLRFWHWYSIAGDDYGYVQLKVVGSDVWQTISETYNQSGSGVWSSPSIDLSAFADSSVQIAFLFISGNYNADLGWYIDDITLFSGPIVFNNPENWELGLGDWYSDRGTWEVGTPTSGPGGSYTGQECVGTRLAGGYSGNVYSRLISPEFIIPSADQNPRLRFWHWFSMSDDNGRVQIKIGSGSWQTISETYINYCSGVWTRTSIDLVEYADSTVQIAFLFQSGTYNSSTGWYIDDIEILSDPVVFNNPENWEMGLGDWYSDIGTWEVGKPTSGPGSSYSGQNCAATRLAGSYADNVYSRLISPKFIIPSADHNPRLRFWHWFSMSDDNGRVQIKIGSGSWQTISETYINYCSGVWTRTSIDLGEYADSTVQIAFLFHSGSYNTTSGWYIDDIALVTEPIIYNNPENWEMGQSDWYSDRGTWEVGVPTSGPGGAHMGLNCAATRLDGNYSGNVNSRLISPVFTIPGIANSPRLRFWHWFNFYDDYGLVEIRVVGSPNWINLSGQYIGNSGGVWTYTLIDLSNYADSTVQISFSFISGNYNTSHGWYIDDVLIDDNSGLVVDAGPDITIPYGGAEWLFPTIDGGTPPLITQWTPPDGLDDPTSQYPVASPTQTTTYQVKATDANGCFRTDNITIFVPYDLTLKTFLEGPYSGTSMNTNLNSGGYLPLSQPYNLAPWNYPGSESVGSIPNPNIVDWVLIELRQTTGDASTAKFYKMVDQMAAFLLNNGSIVGLDGSSPLEFTYPITQNLFVVVWHRNHLGIMSANAVTHTGGNYTFNYTTSLSNIYGGTKSCKQLSSGVWGMISGDASSNGNINNPDKNDKWFIQSGSTGYFTGDFNMDGSVDATDLNDFWIPNAGMGTQVD